MQRLNVDVEKVLRFKILSRQACVFCTRAKMLLNKYDIPFEEKLVTDQTEMNWLRRQGYKTFPIIYDENELHIGGYDQLKELVESFHTLVK